jgi:hypothetical protein
LKRISREAHVAEILKQLHLNMCPVRQPHVIKGGKPCPFPVVVAQIDSGVRRAFRMFDANMPLWRSNE